MVQEDSFSTLPDEEIAEDIRKFYAKNNAILDGLNLFFEDRTVSKQRLKHILERMDPESKSVDAYLEKCSFTDDTVNFKKLVKLNKKLSELKNNE